MRPRHVLLALLAGATSTVSVSQSVLSTAEDAASAAAEDAASAAVENASDSNQAKSSAVHCGGETSQAVVDAYFAELSRGIEEGRSPSWFNRFLDDRFNVIRDGKFTAFDTEDFVSVTPRFFSMDDWRQIASRGSEGLEDVGWRGCLYDHGKVWFEADGDGFRLHSINHDLPWVEPN